MQDYFDYLLKFLIIGNTNTGKSCLLLRFTENKFDENKQHTIGVEFASKIISVANKNLKLQIWDTAGQERFRSVTRSYYRGAAGALLVYDITNRSSFIALGKWLADTRHLADPEVTIVLVGNKCDLENRREVTRAEAEEFAHENNLLFFETSACTSENVNDAFINCSRTILSNIESGSLDPDRVGSGVQTGSVKNLTSVPSKQSGKYRGKSVTAELKNATADCQC